MSTTTIQQTAQTAELQKKAYLDLPYNSPEWKLAFAEEALCKYLEALGDNQGAGARGYAQGIREALHLLDPAKYPIIIPSF